MALNFGLGIGNGALLILAETLLYPAIILALFVSQLTDNNLLIGLVPAIATGVWFLPQLLAAAIVQGRRRQLPWATAASIVQATSIALLAIVGYRAGSISDDRLLRTFFICYVVYNLAAGFANVPATAVMVKAVSPTRRGLFFRQRNLWGGILAIAAGLVIRQVFGHNGTTFPRNFALLFTAAAVALAAAAFLQATMREPLRIATQRSISPTRSLREGPRALADGNYRRFLFFRVLLSLSAIADPFFIVYALRELHASGSIIGVYVLALVVARFISTPIWARISARFGNRAVLQYAALFRLLAPVVAVLLPYVVKTDLYEKHVTNDRVALYLFGIVFAAYGAALSGQILSNFGYILDIAPEHLRSTYIGLANTVLAVVGFAPVLGAVIIDHYGYDRVFLVATFIGLIAVFAGGILTDTHTSPRAAPASWRLRRARPSSRSS
jgi:MFS family permease